MAQPYPHNLPSTSSASSTLITGSEFDFGEIGRRKGGRKRQLHGNTAVLLLGSVYKRYPQGKSVRRTNSSIELPRKDTVCSSQEVFSCSHQPRPFVIPSTNHGF